MDSDDLASPVSQMNLGPDSPTNTTNQQKWSRAFRRDLQHDQATFPEMTAELVSWYWTSFEEHGEGSPEPAPRHDPSALIRQVLYHRETAESGARGGDEIPVFLAGFGTSTHSSSTPIDSLRRLGFADMLMRRVHLGCYLLCRIIAPSFRMVSVQTVVEDTDGIAHYLAIYNFPSTFDCPPDHIDAIFPVGSILAIREPTFKAPLKSDGLPVVRVDSPSDIMFVAADSPLLEGVVWKTGNIVPMSPTLPSTADAWWDMGDAHFDATQYFLATSAYSRALALNPDAASVLLNRAEAYLRLGYYSGARCDADRVLSMTGIEETYVSPAIFLLAQVQYCRGEYDDAERNFIRWKDGHPGADSADLWIDLCHLRQRESKKAQYDWAALYARVRPENSGETQNAAIARADVAEYTGPIEVRRMAHRGGGRGVVASTDVNVGDLLLVAKPFVSVDGSEMPHDRIILTMDRISKAAKGPTDALFLARIVEKLHGNPDLRDQLYHLYAGPEYPSLPDGFPPASTEPIANDFFEPKIDIDIRRLEAICAYNSFCPLPVEKPQIDVKNGRPAALYPRASLFNHSCAANAVWYCVGDVMIIRAAESIPAGMEITIPYTVEESFLDREQILQKHMPDGCKCWLCEEDRKDGAERLRRRHELKATLLSAGMATLPELRTLEKAVRETFRPDRGAVRPMSALALDMLAHKLLSAYADNPRRARPVLREALQHDMEALKCLGFEVHERVARGGASGHGLPIGTDRFPTVTTFSEPAAIMLRIVCTYLNLRDDAKAAAWMKAALWLTDASLGGGKELFMLVHEEMLEKMGIRDFAARVLGVSQ